MSISDSPRFINTPTLLEEYQADQKGYDEVVSEDATIALSREYDSVSGNEEFYKAIFSHIALPSVAVVSGNEGFMETVKKGINVIIQAVKDFFKWLFSFFTGKKEIAERKAVTLQLTIEKHGVSTGEIPYPANLGDVYNKPGVPANNLSWMSGAMDDCSKAIKRVEAYIEATTKACLEISKINITQHIKDDSTSDAMKGVADSLLAESQKALGIEKLNAGSTLYGRVDIQMDTHGKLKELPDPPSPGKDPKFRTDQTQVTALLKKLKELLAEADGMLESAMSVEQVSLKSLNSALEFAKQLDMSDSKKFTTVSNEIQTMIRNVMANLKLLQTIVYRTIIASTSILTATVKKG